MNRFVWVLALGLVACSSNSSSPDARGDGGAVSEAGGKLWPCDNPGKTCNAHSSCAINPVCAEDFICRPSSFQECDDGLECTDNVCEGAGLCRFAPKAGFCSLPVRDQKTKKTANKCFKAEERNPNDACQVCATEGDRTKWASANGGACDDGNPCTKDDYCQNGRCTGTSYQDQCADNLSCTEDVCDGKGGCGEHKLRPTSCLINGKCYSKGETDANGCNVCDPSKTQSAWTSLGDHCEIGSKCYKPGDADSTGCGVCDPATKIDGWTVKKDACLIGGKCYTPKELDTTKCGECDPSKSKTDWTSLADKCLIGATCYDNGKTDDSGCLSCNYAANAKSWTLLAGAQTQLYDFEGGAVTGWTFEGSSTAVKWQASTRRPGAGTHSLYYGDPAKGNFDTGWLDSNDGKAVSPSVAISAGKKAALRFMLYMDTESGAYSDVLEVSVVDGSTATKVWTKTYSNVKLKAWQEIVVDVTKYAGKSVKIQFVFDTVTSYTNSGEGVFIDNVQIHHGC
ncbi:MAG: choice-of-anchor J domain-containing protein [Deltaproteobacteria bacterium]|nr:choice-of-anchor J domain-containing protein [Deltaproteobacteria bacterium]